MNQTLTCILLLLSSFATFGKYVYIKKRMNWQKAQNYCRLFHTDLAPVSDAYDTRRLRRLADKDNVFIWIGLERNSTDRDKWLWSGGGEASNFFWAEGEPSNFSSENYGVINNYKWYDSSLNYQDPFFCYNVIVVRKRKTWEEAVEYCREHHRDLASIASKTEMLLIQKELNINVTTENIWIGLRFISWRWQWVDRQPLRYKAWCQPSCPEAKLKCGALVTGRTKNNTTNNTGSNGVNTPGGCNVFGVAGNMWEARDCEERLHFLCY